MSVNTRGKALQKIIANAKERSNKLKNIMHFLFEGEAKSKIILKNKIYNRYTK